MNIVVVTPTYNEVDNVERLLKIVGDVFSEMSEHTMSLLIVDGNSPDGTGALVQKCQEKYPWLKMLVETKKAGLGAAYTEGFKYAISHLAADVIIEMDSDLQHDPHVIPELVSALDNADYVIGSRFIHGGSIPREWGLKRKLLSVGGNILSRLVLGLFNVTDFTSGFKASRVAGFVEKLDLDNILSKGFAYKLDLLYRMSKLGARIKEVPITFGVRDRGDSKMEKDNTLDSLRVVMTLRFGKDYSKFLKFCVVGLGGLFIDTSFFNILFLSGYQSGSSAQFSGFIAMVFTFLLNNFWSFDDRKHSEPSKILFSFIPYIAISLVPIFVRSQLVTLAANSFGDTFIVNNLAFFVGILLGLIWNYFMYNNFIWRKSNG